MKATPMLTVDGYPIVDATRVALDTTRRFLEQDECVRLPVGSARLPPGDHSGIHGVNEPPWEAVSTVRDSLPQVTRVIFVVFSDRDEKVFRSLASEYFPAVAPEPEDAVSTKVTKTSDETAEDEDHPLQPSSQTTVVGEAEADGKVDLAADKVDS